MMEKLKLFTRYDGACWRYFAGHDKNGYGRIYIDRQSVATHRLSLAIHLKLDIKDHSWQANHKLECRFRDCWNPDHLYKGNKSQNALDCVKEGTHPQASKTHCKNGHKFSPNNTYWHNHHRQCRTCRKARAN
jgi:hypothetical protein